MRTTTKKNYVSIRIQTAKSGQLNHDTRQKKESYVINNIENIYLDKNFVSIKQNNDDKETTIKLKSYLDSQKKLEFQRMKKDCSIYNKRGIQKNTNLEVSGIITFSETMKKDYSVDPEDFQKRAIGLLKEFEQKHNTKILNSSIHLDEKTPHIHFSFLNYNFKNHRTSKRTLKKSDLEDLQDLGEKYFKDYERGYVRGEKVSDTGNKHQTVKQSHSIEEFKKDISNLLNNTKTTLEDLTELRQLKRLDVKQKTNKDEIQSDKEILKELTKQINREKKIIKLLEKNLDKILDKNIKLWGVDKKQLEIDLKSLLTMKIDENDLTDIFQNIEQEIRKLENKNTDLTEQVEKLKDNIEEEQEKNISQKIGVIEQNIEMNKIKSKNQELKKEVVKIKDEIKEIHTFINSDIDRKSQYEQFKERRQSYTDKKKESLIDKDLTPRNRYKRR